MGVLPRLTASFGAPGNDRFTDWSGRHRWLLRSVVEVPGPPDDFVDPVRVLEFARTPAAAEAVVTSLRVFGERPPASAGWSTRFMLDGEQRLPHGDPPIDGL